MPIALNACCRLVLVAVASTLLSAGGAVAEQLVGNLGDWRRIEFEGATTHPPEELRAALAWDIDFQLASTPSAPLRLLAGVIRDRLIAGYRASGLPQATVGVGFDQTNGRTFVRVNEGPLVLTGDVVTEGAQGPDSGKVRDAFAADGPPRYFPVSRPRPDEVRVDKWTPVTRRAAAIWAPGTPADLVFTESKRSTGFAEQALARQGFLQAKVTVSHRIVDGSADLVVRVDDPGPRATLASVSFLNARRNAPEDIAAFLGLKEGQPLDADVLESIQRKLWESGRFWKHSIDLRLDGAGHARMSINLDEHAAVTPLGKALSREEAACLNFRNWLDESIRKGADIALQGSAYGGQVVLVLSNNGVVGSIGPAKAPGEIPAGTDDDAMARLLFSLRVGWVLSEPEITVYDLVEHRRLKLNQAPFDGTIKATVNLLPQDDSDTDKVKLAFTAAVQSNRPDGGPVVRRLVELAPVCFIDLVHERPSHKPVLEWKDGNLAVTLGRGTLRVEGATGRLIDLRYAKDGFNMRAEIASRAFEREVAKLTRETSAPGQDASDNLRTTQAMLARLICSGIPQDPDASPQQREALRSAVEKLCVGFSFQQTLDAIRAAVAMCDGLTIPLSTTRNELVTLALMVSLRPCDDLMTRGAWPWTMARELPLAFFGEA
ncbi:MAG: hypothetical protein ACHRHE_22200, partial [Tepidisphaerales bacterium]